MPTSTQIKNNIDTDITNKTTADSITPLNVGTRIKDVVNYVDQEIATVALGYKTYVALLTQIGTNAPTATVLKNTLGGNIVWTRVSAGVYEGTLVGAFTNLKTALYLTPISVAQDISVFQSSSDVIQIKTWNNVTASFAEGQLNKTTLEIRVYQ